MSRTAEQVLSARLDALIPRGFAWPADESSNVAGYLYPGSGMIADAEAFLDALKLEINPGTATRLLDDYEQTLGPDPCGRDALALTTVMRQSLAHQRWVGIGDNTLASFIQMAAALGVTVEIDEPYPPVCGTVICGVEVCGNEALLLDWVVRVVAGAENLEPNAAICGTGLAGASLCGSVLVPVISDLVRRLYCPMAAQSPIDTNLIVIDQEIG
ncbi:DUF2313 domain-containing protein [Acetobacter suratthaniensis]|uniref:DUF2313 domain-containing protein n=1 Tax=Acetobacter suratthaniensis TaxID=1502841 RepID=A0ABS3LMA5_9PROT|nr:putative phage tail protein [Acetobacter suratthaniensis]MBO1328501.1 DUF2313 domain-containing protein [Acetobacter suratthaniensis]MCX2566630.1 DUF2313 domain-containing protein [Acetobacter suratthaniensis]